MNIAVASALSMVSSSTVVVSSVPAITTTYHRRRPYNRTFPLLHRQHTLSPLSFVPPFLHLSTPMRTAVAAVDSSNTLQKEEEGEGGEDSRKKKKYYFVVANAKFMLDEEEHFQEQLAERIRLYGERNLEQDFWLVIEPKFLDDKFPNITNRLNRPAVALVSTNGPWITFMKLRLDRVLCDSFEADSLEEALASNNPVKLEFEKPQKWVAPYPKYKSGWWEPFLPAISAKQQ